MTGCSTRCSRGPQYVPVLRVGGVHILGGVGVILVDWYGVRLHAWMNFQLEEGWWPDLVGHGGSVLKSVIARPRQGNWE